MAYVCYQVVLRDNEGAMQLVGDTTENITEAAIARDAACDATHEDGMIVAFADLQEAEDFREAFKGTRLRIAVG